MSNMHTRWTLGLLTLASMGFELSAGSACRPRPPSLSKKPTTTDGSLLVGDATSISTWNHYDSVTQPGNSASVSQDSSTWGVVPGSRDQESLPPGETTVLMSYSTASSHGTHETGSVATGRSYQPITTSGDDDTTTKQLGSLPIADTTMGVSVPAGQSDGDTNTDMVSLTSLLQPSGTDTLTPSSVDGHDSKTTQSPILSESDTGLPNTSGATLPTLPHHTSSHGMSEEIPSSSVGLVTGPLSQTVFPSSKQTQGPGETMTTPTDEPQTPSPTDSQMEGDTSVITGPLSSLSFAPNLTFSFTTGTATSTGHVESQDATSTNTDEGHITSSSSASIDTASEDVSVSAIVTGTSISRDGDGLSSDTPTSTDNTRLPLEVPTSNTDNSASLATTSDEKFATNPSDEHTSPAVPETQAAGNTIPEAQTTTSPSAVTGTVEATIVPADPKSIPTNDESLITSSGFTKTQGQQTTVTGTDGEVATWSAVKDPELSDVSQTQTRTDDDGAVIVIFPGGWKWSPVGGGRKGGPTPTAVPTVEGDNEDDPDDEDDEEERCTSTQPPTCTITMSYYTNDKGEGTRQVVSFPQVQMVHFQLTT